MKVLFVGKKNPTSWSLVTRCKQCRTMVRLDENDVRYATSFDYGGGCETSYDWVCPNCPADNDLHKLPQWLKDKAYKAWKDNGESMVDMPRPKGFGKKS